MSNKFSALILSLCLVIAGGLFLTSCSDGGYVNPSSATSETDKTSETNKTSDSGDSSDSGEETPEEFAEHKERTATTMENLWKRYLEYYPDLESSDYVAQYNAIKLAVANATTTEQLRESENDFNTLIDVLRENLTLDLEAYKAGAIQYATEYWNDALKKHPEAANNEDYAARHKAIMDKLNEATTEEAVNDAMNELYALVGEITGQGTVEKPDDDLNAHKESATNDLTEMWEQLSKMYPDLGTSPYQEKYIYLLAAIENATTVDEINRICDDFEKLVRSVYESDLRVDLTEYKRVAKESIITKWNNLLKQYGELAGNKTFCDRYNAILSQIEAATVKQAVDSATATFVELMNDISIEYDEVGNLVSKAEKEAFIDYVKKEWSELTKLSDKVEQNYGKDINELLNSASKMIYRSELDDLSKWFNGIKEAINREYGSTILDEYKEFAKRSIGEKWEAIKADMPIIESNTEFVNHYNDILDAIDGATDQAAVDAQMSEFDRFMNNDVDAWVAKERTLQDWISSITLEVNDFKNRYEDKITPDIESEINRLYQAFLNSKTAQEVLDNKDALLKYLEETKEKFTSQVDDEALTAKKSQLQYYLSETYNQIQQNYSSYFSFSEEVYAGINNRINEINVRITNSTTYAELDEIAKEINDEFVPQTEDDLLCAAIEMTKQTVIDAWAGASGLTDKNSYEQLKNDVLYITDFCKDAHDICRFYEDIAREFSSVLSNEYGKELYDQLALFYFDRFDYPIQKAAEQKLNVGDPFNYIKGSENVATAAERFAKVKDAYESVKDMVYLKDASLSVRWVTLKLGATADDAIEAIASGIKIIGHYSNESTKEFTITADMIGINNNVDFTTIGDYTVYISFEAEYIKGSYELMVIIEPDMANAEEIGTYAASGYYLSQSSAGSTTKIVLYNNGVLKLIWDDSATFYAYTDKGDYIELNFGRGYSHISGATTELLTFTKTAEGNFFDYYCPEGEPIYEFNGNSVDLPGYIWVYGPYTGKNQYVAIYSSGENTDENGRHIGIATYCTLDIENKKLTMYWVKSSEPNTVYTWDDSDYNFGYLKEFLDDYKTESIKKVYKDWDELKAAGYNVSYWDCNTYEGPQGIIDRINMAMYRTEIEQAMNTWTYSILDQIKHNSYKSEVTLNFTPSNLSFDAGGDIEDFILKNIVGRTFTAWLNYDISGKTITITRDMITYNGSLEYGPLSFYVEYYDELYQQAVTCWFEISVNVTL